MIRHTSFDQPKTVDLPEEGGDVTVPLGEWANAREVVRDHQSGEHGWERYRNPLARAIARVIKYPIRRPPRISAPGSLPPELVRWASKRLDATERAVLVALYTGEGVRGVAEMLDVSQSVASRAKRDVIAKMRRSKVARPYARQIEKTRARPRRRCDRCGD